MSRTRSTPASRPAFIETMEARQLLSVSMSDGWTNVGPARDSKIIHVSSSSGSDSNPGTSAKPVKSLSRAVSMTRERSADQVLLKRGDTWNSGFGEVKRTGRSASEPFLIGAYGTGSRPKLLSGNKQGLDLLTHRNDALNHVVVQGIHFHANGYNGSNGSGSLGGIRVLRHGSNVLIEDCFIQGYKDNIVLDTNGTFSGLKVRRNVIVDAFNTGRTGNGHAQGLYAGPKSRNVTIEENVFDHNGYKEGVAKATMFNHSIYVQTGAQNTVVRNNIISRSSMRGVLSRGGATVQNNLFVRNPVAIQVGNSSSSATGNVILEGNDIPVQELGKGVEAFSMRSLTVKDNVIAHDISKGRYNNIAVNIMAGVNGGQIANNIVYNWQHGFFGVRGQFSQSNNKITTSNQLGSGSRPSYTDPNRLLGKYNASLGRTGTMEAFISTARQQRRGAWDSRYTAAPASSYIRNGFKQGSHNRPSAAAPSTTAASTTTPVSSDVMGPRAFVAPIAAGPQPFATIDDLSQSLFGTAAIV
jgi:hypothetical protein